MNTITDEEIEKLAEKVYPIKERVKGLDPYDENKYDREKWIEGYKANPLHRVVDEHFEHNLFMMNADVWTNEHDWTMTIDKFKKCLSEYASQFKHSLPVSDEGWISVEDKPKEPLFLLVNILRIDGLEDISKAYWDGNGFYNSDSKNADKIENEYWIVTHWRPLPNKPNSK